MQPVSRRHRLDIKLMEPTVFAVSPLSTNEDIKDVQDWLASSGTQYSTTREAWKFYTRCSCRNTEHCLHYVMYVRFRTRGEATLFKLSWM